MLVSADEDGADRPLVARAVARSLSGRVAVATQEVEQLVEATYRVVSRDGAVDPRVRDILLEAGLSTQVFYRHFRSKDDLLLVLFADGRRRLAHYLAQRIATYPTPPPPRPSRPGPPRLRDTLPREDPESEAVLVGLRSAVIEDGAAVASMKSTDP